MTTKPTARKAKITAQRTVTKKPAPTRVAAAKPNNKPLAKLKAKAPAATITLPAPAASAGTSKQSRLIALLRAAPGATIEQMMKLTGWQAHTVRGAISGVLRKRLGLNVACAAAAPGEASVYRIVGAGVSA
jgi:hypothetical protein